MHFKSPIFHNHLKKLSALRQSRMNVNIRTTNLFINDLILIADRQFSLISRGVYLPDQQLPKGRLIGLVSLTDSTEEILQNLIDEFSIYWDRYSNDLQQPDIDVFLENAKKWDQSLNCELG